MVRLQIVKPPLQQDEGALVVPPAFTAWITRLISVFTRKVLLLALTGVPDPLYEANAIPTGATGLDSLRSGFHPLSCCLAPPAALWQRTGLLGSALVFWYVRGIIPEEEGMSRFVDLLKEDIRAERSKTS